MAEGGEMKKAISRIFYQWWGNANIENRQWTLLSPSGELEDYGSKNHCIMEAKRMGWKYQVERNSKKFRGKVTILETNI